MSETDLYFTHTIVGAPVSVILGVRVTLPTTVRDGVEVNLSQGSSRISQVWQDWVLMQQGPAGRPQARPGPTRRWLLRHSLLLALLGLLFGGAALGFAAWQFFSITPP